MSDDDIDFDRVVSDPSYRREVMAFLKTGEATSPAKTGGGDSSSPRGEVQPRP